MTEAAPKENYLGDSLRQVGTALYGEIYVSKLAHHMGWGRRSLQRVIAGTDEVADERAVLIDLKALVQKELDAARLARDQAEAYAMTRAARVETLDGLARMFDPTFSRHRK